MTLKIETQTAHPVSDTEKKINIEQIKQQLIALLNDFPYDSINLEKDTHITDLLDLVQDNIDFDRSSVLISKDKLIESLLCKKCASEKQESVKYDLNPALNTLSYFDLVAKNQEKTKAKQYEKFQEISSDLDLLAQGMSLFQTQSSDGKIDFSSNEKAKTLIDSIKSKWGIPVGTVPYAWENKNDVISFLTQKQKELTHRSQEVMLNLQHCADQLKSMVDATKEMIKANGDLCEYINRKTNAG